MSRRRRPLDVAIVGMACRFPGATSLSRFWQNVLGGRSSLRDVPRERWDANVFCDPDSGASDRVSGRRGGYLDEPILIDSASLGVMPRTVEGGEPEQFLVLDAVRSALEDAGYAGGVPEGRRTEVVIGRGNYFNRGNLTRLQHGRVLAQTMEILGTLHPDWTEAKRNQVREALRASLPPFESATIAGQLTNATAGRVSHHLNLSGPSYVVDAASASALVAVDLAARSLATRRADLAIVGGVYVQADVDFPMVFSRLGVLSRSGVPRPFGRDADGMVPGEGVGVLVLKRLRDAERRGDRIYAVLKGVGLASDGRGRGLASPDARGHLRAIRRAYRASGIDPGTVRLIEGHGLGVPAADRAELKALRAAFPPMDPGASRVVGAVSALIGHAMPAAGMAGLIKAALALHHRALPASPDAGELHPLLRESGDRFRMIPASRPWIGRGDHPRRAGVNAFGFAGINAHAVLEEHSSSDGEVPGALHHWRDEAVLIAAEDRPALIRRMGRLARLIRRRPEIDLKDLAATLNAEASAGDLPSRLGLVVGSPGELADRLEKVAERLGDPTRHAIRDAKGTYYWDQPAGAQGGLAFLFPGEGSQYPGMLADLCMHFPEVREPFDQIDRMAVTSKAIAPPSERLFGGEEGDEAGLWETSTAVHLVLASQWALFQLLKRLGLRPDAMCGHSSGEFPALVAAGVLPGDEALERRFNELASVFSGLERSGVVPEARMLGVATDRARIEAIVRESGLDVSIAVDNCPHQVILVGPPREMEGLASRVRSLGIACEELPFARAYHSEAFGAALDPLREFFTDLSLGRPGVPVYSCCTAEQFPEEAEEIRGLAIAQWTRPVEFRRTIEAMYRDGLRVFVDVGGRGNLSAFVEDTLKGRPSFAVAANLPRRSGLSQLNHLVASLFAQGITPDPRILTARRDPRPVDLEADPKDAGPAIRLHLGFPEMRLAEEIPDQWGAAGGVNGKDRDSTTPPPRHPAVAVEEPKSRGRTTPRGGDADREPNGEAFFDVMTSLLESQHQQIHHALAPRFSHHEGHPVSAGDDLAGRGGRLRFDSGGVEAGPARGAAGGRIGIPEATGNSVQTPDPEPAGREWVEWLVLDAQGDPVAEHHTFGGRRLSVVDPEMKGLPVLPFTVMAEMLVEASAKHAPGGVLVGLQDVRARRWIRYEEEPIRLEIRIEAIPGPSWRFRAAMFNRGPVDRPIGGGGPPEVEAVVEFAPGRPSPPAAAEFDLGDEAGMSRFTAESIYAEQWLFHGPALRAVAEIGRCSDRGIEGVLRVLPRKALKRDPDGPGPHTDPIVLDAFTHLLGCWGLDQLAEGDVIFPLRMGSLSIFGEDPPEGADVPCRIRVKEVDRLRVKVGAELLRPDGRVWMRLDDWEDWRFYWPPRYRDVFRMPDRALLGEPIPLPGPARDAVAVWLQPPEDMGKPIWRDVLEQVQLSPEERAGCLRPSGPEGRRTLRLWGRIAAKEAIRRLWLADGGAPVYPADLSIEPDRHGRPCVRLRADPARTDLPVVSIAHVEGVAVALASRNPRAAVGIDVERVVPRGASFEDLAFSTRERSLLDRVEGRDRAAWITRIWCAKEAVGKASGRGMVAGPSSTEAVSLDLKSGEIGVRLGPDLAAARPDLAAETLAVGTALQGDYAYAWVVKEPERS